MKKSPENLECDDIENSPVYRRLCQSIENRPIKKGRVKVSGNQARDIQALEDANDIELAEICSQNDYMNNLCQDDNFWARRVLRNYGTILGELYEIEEKYKPNNTSWKDYYLWLSGAVNGDIFMVYLYADAIGREDILLVLEYLYPDALKDMESYFKIDESSPIRKMKGYETGFFTKKQIMYLLGIYMLRFIEAKSDRSKNFKKACYILPTLGKINSPLDFMIKINKILTPVTPYLTFYTTYDTNQFRQHFLNLINYDPSKLWMKIKDIAEIGMKISFPCIMGFFFLVLGAALQDGAPGEVVLRRFADLVHNTIA